MIIVLFCEGLMIGISPQLWQRTMRQLAEQPPEKLRKLGLSMVVAAIILLLIIMYGSQL